MSPSNLAVVFGPNLIHPGKRGNVRLDEICLRQTAINKFTEYLLTNCQAICDSYHTRKFLQKYIQIITEIINPM